MIRSRHVLACGLMICLLPWSSAIAQDTLPRIGYAYPAGGRQGTSFQITLGGQYLNDIGRITFSGAGVAARKVAGLQPMTEADVRVLRDRLSQLAKDQKELAVRREMAEIGRKLARHMAAQLRRQTHPAISETVELEVTIDADAEPGPREMRLETARGVSNPLRFFVGSLPEFREQEPELVTDMQGYNIPVRYPATATTDISLPAVLNGQLIPREPDALRFGGGFTPGDADRFRFAAKQGQTLVIAASARELIPYLADAVPGWFQATLTLSDAQGRELAFADDYRFHPDPVLVFQVPADGPYVVEIKDAISRGRPDFVYRLTIGELPFITGIFPLGGRVGERTTVEVRGQNLPAEMLAPDDKPDAPGVASAGHLTRDGEDVAGIYPLAVQQGDLISNTVPFAVDSLPECLEEESNDDDAAAQRVTLPLLVNGRIDRPGDWDVFRWEGRAGQQVVVEVNARRLDSPVDSVLELTDAAGQRLAFNDDHDDKADALNTHHADSLLHVTLPSDGTYFVRLGDAQRQGGLESAYRLRISPPQPDFALRVVPSCINASSWRLTPVTVYALRKDGFDGEIALSFQDNPEGIVLIGGLVPAGQDRVRVTLSLAAWAAVEPLRVCLEGRATISGHEIVRPAVAADDMMQAFAYRQLVPAQSLQLVLADSGRFRPGATVRQPPPEGRRSHQSPMAVVSEQPARIPVGGTVEVQVRGSWSGSGADRQLELSDSPDGIAIDTVTWLERSVSIRLRGDPEKALAGVRGNLIVHVFQKRTETNREGKTREYRSFQGPLPAIPFEIVKP